MKKEAIKNLSVFDGLAVDHPEKYAELFLLPQFELVSFGDTGKVIFEVFNNTFIFHLVNFTKEKTRNITENFMLSFVKPYCEKRDITHIQASVERKGMGRKLERLGMAHYSGNIYRGEVKNVF